MYLAAWTTGGLRAGDAGFPHGTFSYSHALIIAAMWTAISVGYRWRQRTQQSRKGIMPVLWLVVLVVGEILLAVTP